MNHIHTIIAASAIIVTAACGVAFAQTPASPTAKTPAPAPSNQSTAAQVETWTTKQWDAAKKEWVKDKKKWADCQKQSSNEKLEGRKSWSFLYKCMTS
jgi:hypothetical protein